VGVASVQRAVVPASVVNDEQIVFGHAIQCASRHAAPGMMSPTRPQQIEEENRPQRDRESAAQDAGVVRRHRMHERIPDKV
jgi:hypothetical protein